MFSCIISVVVFHYPVPLRLPAHLEWPAWVYSTVLAFAIIFRTALAYSRYWEGISSSVAMLAQWRGAYVNLNAFVDASIAEHARMENFDHVEELLYSRARLLRWFSLLNAVAIQTLQWREDPDPLRPMSQTEIDAMEKRRFWDPLLDRESCERIFILSQTSWSEREQIEAAFDKLTHVIHWIEHEVSVLHLFKFLLISSPVLTRVYEDLSGGTLAYCQAHTIAFIPFPFLFAQVLSYLLYVFIFLCPFIVQASLKESELGLRQDFGSWPALVTMTTLLVAGFSCLNEIAIELEDPFREKSNNFPVRVLQRRVDWSSASVTLLDLPRDFEADSFGEETKRFVTWCEDAAAAHALDELPSSVNVPPAAQSTAVACEDLRRSVLNCVQALEKDGMDLWKDMRRTELELYGLAFRAFASDGHGVTSQALVYDSNEQTLPGLLELHGEDRPPESCDVPEEHCPGRPPDQAILNPQVTELRIADPCLEPPSMSSTGPTQERSRTELDLQALLRRSAVVNSRMAPLLLKVMCFDDKARCSNSA